MDRSEPSLVPEWLKGSGSIAGGGSRQQHSASALRSDDRSTTKHGRNKSSLSSGVHVSDRTTSSYFRRSSSSKGSTHLRPYNSNRSLRDGAREGFNEFQDDDEPIFSLNKARDYSDPLGSLLPGKFDKDTLSRSVSTNGRRQEEAWRSQAAGGFSNARNGCRSLGSGLLTKGTDSSSTHEPAFEHDFPSLGSDERLRGSEVGRVPSPGPGTPFPRPSSATLDKTASDGWTSALAEVPGVVGSHSASNLLSLQSVTGNPASVGQTTNGLKMAEAVAQSPARARTPPQLSVDTQRLEELAIKQSRQLIPVTPSMPKSQLVSPLERSKSRAVQQQTKLSPSHLGNQSVRGGLARLEVGKTSNLGKLQVLKPSVELNGTSSAVKDNLGSPNGIKVPQGSLNAAPLTAGSHLKNSVTNQNLAGSEWKPAASLPILEKKPSLQTQSRNDFFNLIKKKSSSGINSGMDDGRPEAASVVENPEPLSIEAGAVDMDAEVKLECSSANSVSNLPTEACGEVDDFGNSCELTLSLIGNQEEHLNYPNEEEVAFLRSLGWEEGAGDGDDEGLTEDEIRTFYEEYMKSRPSCKPLGGQQKIPLKVSEKFCNGSIAWSPDRPPGAQS